MSDSLFDRLAKELTVEERQEMLKQVKSLLPLESEPMQMDEHTEELDLEKAYKESSFLERLWIFILHMFTKKEIKEITGERQLLQIKRKLHKEASIWINTEEKRLTQEFYVLFSTLNHSLEIVRETLARIRREKEDFLLYWGNACFQDFKENLLKETDPLSIEKQLKEVRINIVRDTIEENFNLAFTRIPESLVIKFKEQSDCLFHLQALVNFPLYSLVSSFQSRGGTGLEAEWGDIQSSLMNFADLLHSFVYFPESETLQHLVLFANRERILKEKSEESKKWLEDLYEAFSSIQEMLKKLVQLPIPDFLKLVSENINYTLNDLGGGEDCFYIFRKSWKRRIDHRIALYINQRKIRELQTALLSTWSVPNPGKLGKYNDSFCPDCTFRYVHTMVLLAYFYDELRKERKYPVLDTILKRGEFYKKNNQVEFKQVMDTIHQSKELFENFLDKLEDRGFYTVRLKDLLNNKEAAVETLEKDIKYLAQSIDQEAGDIIKRLLANLRKLSLLLTGILIGDRGEYDTLSNYADLAGPPNRQFKDELVTREFLVNNAYKNINDIFGLEEKTPL